MRQQTVELDTFKIFKDQPEPLKDVNVFQNPQLQVISTPSEPTSTPKPMPSPRITIPKSFESIPIKVWDGGTMFPGLSSQNFI